MARLSRVAPEIPVLDLKSAITFYGHLGFELAGEAPAGEYAIVERDGVALHLFEDKLRRAGPVGVHIFTHELTELFEEFAERGIRFTQAIQRKPWGNHEFRVRDAYGNDLKFTEPGREDE